ncbi:MAG TPA: type II secretion system protein [Bryobacteraceae bacterium]|jgi:general secretion pathway protein J
MKRSTRGVTLLELLIVVTLLSLLSVAMFTAMRIGLGAFTKADEKLMANRKAAGAQRILRSQMEGLVPVFALCAAGEPGSNSTVQMPFFGGTPAAVYLVSTFSLQEGWRGKPQILEIFVIPGEDRGVRLVVNELPYTGSLSAGRFCRVSPQNGLPQFLPAQARPQSFVLADKLAYCRFAYLAEPLGPTLPETWQPVWNKLILPLAVRIEMAPLDPNPSEVQPISVTAPIYLRRDPNVPYADF